MSPRREPLAAHMSAGAAHNGSAGPQQQPQQQYADAVQASEDEESMFDRGAQPRDEALRNVDQAAQPRPTQALGHGHAQAPVNYSAALEKTEELKRDNNIVGSLSRDRTKGSQSSASHSQSQVSLRGEMKRCTFGTNFSIP